MGRKELINLKRTTLNTFFEVCQRYGIKKDEHFNYNGQVNVITFKNNAQILLFDLSSEPSDPLYTRLGSLELTGAFVDESNEIEEKALTILRTRVGRCMNRQLNLTAKVLESFNPAKGHVYNRFYKPWKEQKLPSYRTFIRALVTDNPFLDEKYRDQLLRSDKTTVERLVYGNFEYDDDPSTMIEYDAMVDLFTNFIEPSNQKYLSCDVARFGQDSTVIYVWDGLSAYKCFQYQKQGTEVTIGILKRLALEERIPYSHIVVDEDGIGGGVVDQMKGIKGFVANSKPFLNPVTYQDENYANLKAQCYAKLAELINGRGLSVTMDKDEMRERLIEELGVVKRKDSDDDKKFKIIPKDEMKASLGRSPDFADGLMMRMLFEVSPSLARMGQPAIQRMPKSSQTYRLRSPQPSNLVQ